MTNKLTKCPRGAAILNNRKAPVGSWDLGTNLARFYGNFYGFSTEAHKGRVII